MPSSEGLRTRRSIPFVGRLFQNKNNSKTRTNLLIFITAKVVSPSNAQPEEIYDPRVLQDAQLKRSDVGGFRQAGDPFLPESVQESTPAPVKKK